MYKFTQDNKRVTWSKENGSIVIIPLSKLEDYGIDLADVQPYQTAEEAASQAKAAIDDDTAAKMANFEVEALGKVFDFSERSKNNFDALLGRLEAGKIPSLPWRSKGTRDNVEYTIEEADQIADAIFAYLSQVDKDAQDAKKALEQ